MATSDKLKQVITEVGDLRERIGATRAKLEALEAQLAQREKDLDALVDGVQATSTVSASARPRTSVAAAPAPAPTPARVQAAPPVATGGTRGRSLAARIVALLNASPDREHTVADMARHFNLEVRQLYGSLSRLTRKRLILRVSEGVFKAMPKGGAVAA